MSEIESLICVTFYPGSLILQGSDSVFGFQPALTMATIAISWSTHSGCYGQLQESISMLSCISQDMRYSGLLVNFRFSLICPERWSCRTGVTFITMNDVVW